jgi:hypothetical protein
MGSPLRIYSGAGVIVTLYDSTNGLLDLGYIEEGANFEQEANNTPISSGNLFMLNQTSKFEIPVLQSDATMLAALVARRPYLQEVYFIALDSALKISNVMLNIKMARSMKAGTPHKYILSGQIFDRAQVTFMANILGTYGSMDTNVASLCTGWTNTGVTSLSNPTSFLGAGHGNYQRGTFADANAHLECKIRFPIIQYPIKMTVSATFHNYTAGTRGIYLGYKYRNAADGLISTASKAISLTNGQELRDSYETTLTPGSDILTVGAFISGGASGSIDLGIDEVQLELGELTAWLNG